MDQKSKKVIYFTNIFPVYRLELWKELMNLKDINFHIFFSKKGFNEIKTSPEYLLTLNEKSNLHYLKNWSFRGILFFQSKIIKTLIFKTFDVALFLGDFKIISNWIGIIICKVKGKKTALWTHGLYGDESFFKKFLRLFFFRLVDHIFLYEKRAKQLLINNGFKNSKLTVVYNSINLSEQTKYFNEFRSEALDKSEDGIKKLVFLGRLTKVKRIDLAIKSLIKLNNKRYKYQLIIIGDGEEENYLKNIVKSSKAEQYILFRKGIYDEREIAKIFLGADLLISPGNVGLNCIHALSYGLPVITHNNFNNQMPEHESIKQGFNGILHNENDIVSICEKIEEWFREFETEWSREKIRYHIIEKYNPKIQAKIFQKAFLKKL